MTEFRPILLVNGSLLALFGTLMLIPAMVDVAYDDRDWAVFVASGLVTVFVGVLMWAISRGGGAIRINTRQGFIMTTLAWVILPAFGSLPLIWSETQMGVSDAFFEAMSGITTTGATVLVGLEDLPPGILTWRALLQWIGGLGIIVMGIAVLPMLQVGGMQLFRAEAFDAPDKILPRASQIAFVIIALYSGATLACALAYGAVGMNGFDAILHAMTTVATGGFSTKDASIAHFQSPGVEWVAITFMIVGSLPFLLYAQVISGNIRALLADDQVRVFLLLLGGFTVLVWQYRALGATEAISLRETLFNMTSIMTGTGYASTDYNGWGPFAVVAFLFAMCMGGCAGSTSCGIKTFRFIVIWEDVRQHISRILSPSRIHVKRYNGRPLRDDVSAAVQSFFFVYFGSILVLAALLNMNGLDPMTALSGAATAISNVGPGLGETIGPAGNFQSLDNLSIWLLSFGMLLGRLELFSVLVLFLPQFWRR
ncbi:MAG: TrkH family potassium uptake protein [Pseudomonadota bacterium]